MDGFLFFFLFHRLLTHPAGFRPTTLRTRPPAATNQTDTRTYDISKKAFKVTLSDSAVHNMVVPPVHMNTVPYGYIVL